MTRPTSSQPSPQPRLTAKQQLLLHYLYLHRFLTRAQLQELFEHVSSYRVSLWLRELWQQQYVARLYEPDYFAGRSQPASYYLGLNGIRWLKATGKYQGTELDKRYHDKRRSRSFVGRCVLVADCFVALSKASVLPDGGTARYSVLTRTELMDPTCEYHFLTSLEGAEPQLLFIKHTQRRPVTYLFEIFDATLPRYSLRYKLKKYVEFFDDDVWSYERKGRVPIAALVCASRADLQYAQGRIRTLIDDSWNSGDVPIRLTSVDELKRQGINAEIWEPY